MGRLSFFPGWLAVFLAVVAFRSNAGEMPALLPDNPDAPSASLLRQLTDATRLFDDLQRRGGLSATELVQLQALQKRLQEEVARRSRDQQEEALAEQLKLRLKERVAEKRDDRAALEQLARFYLFRDEPDKAMSFLEKAGPASPEDVFHPLLMTYLSLRLGDYRAATTWMKLAETQFAGHTPLRLSRPVLCSQISAYRIYTPLAAQAVSAGEDVLLYLEIDGAVFRQSGEESSCDLHFGLSLRDELQQVIWSEPNYGDWRKTYRGPIQEMHVMVNVRVPNHLASGRYALLVSCDDRIGGKNAETHVAFPVSGATAQTPFPPALAPTVPEPRHVPGAAQPGTTPAEKLLEDPFRLLDKKAAPLSPPELD